MRPDPIRLSIADRARRGLTLVELIMVMGLLALVLGIGLGAIADLDLGQRASVGLVQNGLRAANNWAVSRRAPARVRIEAGGDLMVAEGLDVIGTWHFEQDPPPGAFELKGTLAGAQLVEDGFIGRAVTFNGLPSGARFTAPVDQSASYDLRSGFQIQLALRPEAVSSGRVLDLGGAVGIEVTRGLGLAVWFAAWRADELGTPRPAGKARLETEPGALLVDRWNRVLVSYDRGQLTVEVEGLRVAALPESADVGPLEGPLVLGGGQRPWAGSVDALVISAVSVEEQIELPRNTTFAADAPKEIRFASGGGLDRTAHREPVQVGVDFLDGSRATVQVNLYGTVE